MATHWRKAGSAHRLVAELCLISEASFSQPNKLEIPPLIIFTIHCCRNQTAVAISTVTGGLSTLSHD